MAGEWYYAKNNQQYGPCTAQQLKELAQQQEIAPDDLVWKDGMPQWLPAKNFPGLIGVLQMADKPPALPPQLTQSPDPFRVASTTTTNRYSKGKSKSTALLVGTVAIALAGVAIWFLTANKNGDPKAKAIANKAPALNDDFQSLINDAKPQQKNSAAKDPKVIERKAQAAAQEGQNKAKASIDEANSLLADLKNKMGEKPPGVQIPKVPKIPAIPGSPITQKEIPKSSNQKNGNVTNPARAETSASTKSIDPQATQAVVQSAQALKPLKVLKAGQYSDGVNKLTFSPTGNFLLSQADNGEARLWETVGWAEVKVDPRSSTGGESWRIKEAAFSPDGKYLACIEGESHELIKIWDLTKTPAIQVSSSSVGLHSTSSWHGVLWSINGSTVITRSSNFGLQFWGKSGPKGESRESIYQSIGGGSGMSECPQGFDTTNASISPLGDYVAISSKKGTRIRKIPSGELAATLKQNDEATEGQEDAWDHNQWIGFSPDGKTFATTEKKNGNEANKFRDVWQVTLWDTASWKQKAILLGKETVKDEGEEGNFQFAAFSPDSSLVATTSGGTWENIVSIWNTQTGKLLNTFDAMSVKQVVFDSTSKTVIVGGHNYILRGNRYDVERREALTGKYLGRVSDELLSVISLSPDDKTVVTGNGSNEIKVWQVSQFATLPYDNPVAAYRIQKEAENANSQRLRNPAPPISLSKYDLVKEGMFHEQVKEIMGGSGELKSEFEQQPVEGGRFGYKNIIRYIVRYKGASPGSFAVFVFEGDSTKPPLVRKSQVGLK